ncbi:putative Ig domain-containing protein [Subtercola sp. RTI3]|uniref:putative Ig domain-containing protein n=1 Tax=Subtercola sp. RTI3 TaxID=3048639 RepID=UPI002B22474D|nr:putative Ig domain-containing protein [Subtercola sp. RTI3]MEA9986634.1 putative Ig domain-containing protein [Subtercola sp. RTI3]
MNFRHASRSLILCSAAALVFAATLTGSSAAFATTNTYTTFATTTVGLHPFGIAVDSVERKVFVTNDGDGTVTVLNADTGAVIGSPITVGTHPERIAVDSVRHRAYVTNSSSQTVRVIDTHTDSVIGLPVDVSNGSFAGNVFGVAIDQQNGNGWVVTNNSVVIVDGQNQTVVAPVIPMSGSTNSQIAIDSGRRKAWVSNFDADTVTTLDLDSGARIGASLPTGDEPSGISLNSTTGSVVVCSFTQPILRTFDERTRTQVGSDISQMCFNVHNDVNTNDVLSNSTGGSFIDVHDGTRGTTLAQIPAGADTHDFAIDPVTDNIYVTNSSTNKVVAIHQAVSPTITTVGAAPGGTVGSGYSFAVTANGTPSIQYRVSSGTLPDGLLIDPDSGVISGKPTTVETQTFSVTASNGTAPDAVASYTIAVAAAVVTPPPTTTPPTSTTDPTNTTGGTGSGSAGSGSSGGGSGSQSHLASTGVNGENTELTASLALLVMLGGVAAVLGRQRRTARRDQRADRG